MHDADQAALARRRRTRPARRAQRRPHAGHARAGAHQPADHPQARRRRRHRVRGPHQCARTKKCERRARRMASPASRICSTRCRSSTGREPGAVGAALDDASSWCGIIVDGHHVDPVVLRIALRCKRPDRFMLVTDAMPTVGAPTRVVQAAGPARSRSQDNMLRRRARPLAGSDIDMASAVRNAISTARRRARRRAVRMASRYPAAFLRLGHELGRIAPGCAPISPWLDSKLQRRRDLDRRQRIVRRLTGCGRLGKVGGP